MTYKTAPKKPTNLTLNEDLLAEARSLKINLSHAAEIGLRKAIADVKTAQWKHENQEAIKSANQWTEENSLPLAKYRQF